MKRNIITTIAFATGKVSISVLEKLPHNTVEIFNDSSDISKVNTFIETSLSHVEKLIGGKVSKATFVIEPSLAVANEINLRKDSIKIAGETVAKIDIENLIQLITKNNNSEDRRTILVQPLKFEVKDVMTKSYSRAPIHKPGNTLSVTSAVTTISRKTYEYIQQAAKAVNVEIAQILLSNQTTSYAHLSKNALADGAILININNNQVNVTINKNNSTVASMSLYDYGFKYLIKGVMSEFNCSKETARDLVAAHASIKNNIIRVIYSNQIGSEDWSYTNKDLENIIRKYLLRLVALVKKYLSQKNVLELPIVLSGKLSSLEGIGEFLKERLETEKVAIHQALTFVEMNELNTNTLGVINFIDIMNLVLGRHYDTIVNTNPNLMSSLKTTKQNNNWFIRIKNKIGGKHDWN